MLSIKLYPKINYTSWQSNGNLKIVLSNFSPFLENSNLKSDLHQWKKVLLDF